MRNRMVSQNLAKSTIEGYVYGARQLAVYCQKEFTQIDTDEVYAFLCHLKEERGLSRQTMRIAVSGIKYLYTHLLSREDIVREVPYPKQEKYLPEILTGQEVKRLLDKTSNLKHRAFLKLVYSAGLRRSEACSLLLSDVDFKAMQIRIRQGKGRKDRYATLSRDAAIDLKKYIRHIKPEKYLFHGRIRGTRLSDESARWAMTQALKRAGISKTVSLHSLRHSFASHSLSLGANLLTIQNLLGHEDIRTTMVYLHINQLVATPFKNPLDVIYPSGK
jgi:site-specific recombinase XerD